jgi:predicted kinase
MNNKTEKKLYILQGITGSGKTTKAHTLTDSAYICEADQYWLNCAGDYLFVPSKLGCAHKWCQDKVRRFMSEDIKTIVCSNTNLTPKERKPYIDLAKEYDYDVELVLPDSPWFLDVLPRLRNKTFTDDDVWTFVRKNTHGVPFDSVKKMMERWDETFNIE